MSKSLRLSLYLATRPRAERPAGQLGDADARERHGHYAAGFAKHGPVVWVHTGADTEGTSALELVRRMRAERDDATFVVTTSGAQRVAAGAGARSSFAPAETIPAVRRFLSHWQPDVAIWTAPDLRPALIAEASMRGVPMFLLDAGTAVPGALAEQPRAIASDLLGMFTHILAPTEAAAEQLQAHGVPAHRRETIGYLREGASAPACNQQDHDGLAASIGGRPTWLAADVPPGELEAVLAAHRRAELRSHRLLLILVPSAPDLGPQWRDQLARTDYAVALRSDGAEPDRDVQIYIADPKGELGLWYRLAPVSFLGGSFSAGARVNPYHAASLGSAILHGPKLAAHSGAYRALAAAGATRQIAEPEALGPALEALLSPALAAEMAQRAWAATTEGAEVTDRILDLVLTEIEPL